MDKNQLIDKLNHILAEEFEVDVNAITPDANIKHTLMLNSLDAVDMIAVIEYEFGIKIPSEVYTKTKIFAELYDYLLNNIKEEK